MVWYAVQEFPILTKYRVDRTCNIVASKPNASNATKDIPSYATSLPNQALG